MENFKARFETLLIEKLGVFQEDLQPDVRFVEDLEADSLDMVELIMDFESEFKLTIPDEDAEKIVTVGDAERYLRHKLKLEQRLPILAESHGLSPQFRL